MKNLLLVLVLLVPALNLQSQNPRQQYCDNFNTDATAEGLSSTYQADVFIIHVDVSDAIPAKSLFYEYRDDEISSGEWKTNVAAMKKAGFKKMAVMTTFGDAFTYSFDEEAMNSLVVGSILQLKPSTSIYDRPSMIGNEIGKSTEHNVVVLEILTSGYCKIRAGDVEGYIKQNRIKNVIESPAI